MKHETLLKLVPKQQWAVMQSSKEFAEATERMNKVAHSVPKIYATEDMERHPLALHYFSSASDWYVCEWDGEDLFFGYVILENDFEMSEWGYISRSELLGLEIILLKRRDILNLDLYCEHETIEDALYAKNPKYFYKHKRPDNQDGKGEDV